MRNALPQCARLLAVLLFATSCGGSFASSHKHVGVKVDATCAANQATLIVDPSSARFHHTRPLRGPTDVAWTFTSSTADSIVIKPDAAWPLQGGPFGMPKGTTHTGVGNNDQPKNQYRYSVILYCPGGPIITFDPDIWVD